MADEKYQKEGLSFGEKRHMIIMVIALIVLLGIALKPFLGSSEQEASAKGSSKGSGNTSEKQPAEKKAEKEEVSKDNIIKRPGTARGGAEVQQSVLDTTRKPEPGKYTPGMRLGGKGDWVRGIETDTVFLEPAVDLACDMYEEEFEAAVSEEPLVSPVPEDYSALLGRVFKITGTVKKLVHGEVSLPRRIARKLPLVSYMYHGYVIDDTGRRINFRGVDICKEYIFNRKVSFNGIFAGVEKEKENGERRIPVMVFKTVKRAPIDLFANIDEFKPGVTLGEPAIWDRAEDGFDEAVIEQEPYYHALNILTSISQPDLEKCVSDDIDYFDMLKRSAEPEQHRGKVYRLKGRLRRIEEKSVDPEREVTKKLPHTPYVFVGQIREEETGVIYTFRALDAPKNVKVGDLVEVVGIYVKIYSYTNRRGGTTHTPLIMGRYIKRYREIFPVLEIVGIIGGAVLFLILGAAFVERKRHRQYEKRVRELKKRRSRKTKQSDEQKEPGESDDNDQEDEEDR